MFKSLMMVVITVSTQEEAEVVDEDSIMGHVLTLTVPVVTIDAQWEGMGDVGSARYEPALLPPCPTIKVLSYRN